MITKKKSIISMNLVLVLMLGACGMTGSVADLLAGGTEQAQEQTDDRETEQGTGFTENVSEAESLPAQETESANETETVNEIDEIIAQMPLEDKVAQLFIVTPEVVCGYTDYTMTATDDTYVSRFHEIPVGGIIMMGANLIGEDQTKEMIASIQTQSMERTGLPVFLCVDEEGGTVARISGSGNFDVPVTEDMRIVGENGDVARAEEIGVTMGTYLKDLGFNVDFAPVADVLTNPENVVVYDRSFGSDPYLVSEMDAAFSDGLRSCGILSTYKHFPGHGATEADTHEGYAYTMKTWEELLDAELIPFIDGIEDEVPLIMTGHVALPSVTGDDTPASLSEVIIQEHLIDELGYKGLIVTDALEMGAIVESYSSSEAALTALRAGNDLLLMPADFESAYYGLLDAVKSGALPEERIDASLEKIIRAKYNLLAQDAD